MTKIPHQYLTFFKHRGYPYIDPDTYEFSWWIYKDYYNARINAINEVNRILHESTDDVVNVEAVEVPRIPGVGYTV